MLQCHRMLVVGARDSVAGAASSTKSAGLEERHLVGCLAWFTTARLFKMNAEFAKNAENPVKFTLGDLRGLGVPLGASMLLRRRSTSYVGPRTSPAP